MNLLGYLQWMLGFLVLSLLLIAGGFLAFVAWMRADTWLHARRARNTRRARARAERRALPEPLEAWVEDLEEQLAELGKHL